MSLTAAPYAVGFQSLTEERSPTPLAVAGQLPTWLRGTLLRTGPALFDIDGQAYRHWFDGLAMLYRFDFQAAGTVQYSNRCLRSGAYCEAQAQGEIWRPEFATRPQRSLWQRLFSQRPVTDNGNVSVTVMAGQPVAVTETPQPCQFRPNSLETMGPLQFDDDLAGQVTTAHPHIDFERGELISYIIQFGRQSTYQFYAQSLKGDRRRRLAAVPVDQPAYLHSFGLTPNYIVLVEFPLRVNPLRLATSRFHNTPFIENYRWQPALGTQFHLISRATGEVVNTAQAEPLFSFHHVNAYETGDAVVVDLSAYQDAAIIQQFYLDALRGGQDTRPAHANLRRCWVPLTGDTVEMTMLAEALAEVPRINYQRCNGRPYRYVYGGDSSLDLSVLDRLVKVDVEARTTALWQAPATYPGEPVFVSAPDAVEEDEGVVLSVVLDAVAERSYLLVLDAQTFTEQARILLPHVVPFHFHGQYFDNPDRPANNPHLHR